MMRAVLNPLLCLLVTLGLLNGGVARAVAGVAMARVETAIAFIICTEGGPHEILVDAQGRVVEHGSGEACRQCPDCSLATGLPGTPIQSLIRPTTAQRQLAAISFISRELEPALGLASARAPPIRG